MGAQLNLTVLYELRGYGQLSQKVIGPASLIETLFYKG